MTIETKFNVGDEVFILEDNRIKKCKILIIWSETDKNGTGYSYRLGKEVCDISCFRGPIFKTKQELIDSL